MKMHTRLMSLTVLVVMGASIFLSLLVHAAETRPLTKAQQTFATPDDAVNGLVEAVRANDKKTLLKIFGSDASSWLFTGDKVADQEEMDNFVAKYDAKNSLEFEAEEKAVLNVGDDDWPFPAPIVKQGNGWKFDVIAGREELTNRRVGRNELSTIQTLRAIVDAQREYAAADADQNGYHDYARKFMSSPGKKDGLYWPSKTDEPDSPLGPLVGAAAREGYGKKSGNGKPQPYHGYSYRILAKQGMDAPGGAFDYLVKDKLIGGLAVVAYPVSYSVSGVKTFIVNHDGTVYEKDLGPYTTKTGAAMTKYNPDSSWAAVTD